jgi:hypothetical protein
MTSIFWEAQLQGSGTNRRKYPNRLRSTAHLSEEKFSQAFFEVRLREGSILGRRESFSEEN